MGALTRLEQRLVDSHALEGRLGEVFGWRLAAMLGGWALVPRRDDWHDAPSEKVALVPWSETHDAPTSDVVVVHLQKGREATRDGVWRAWSALTEGGRLILAGGNDLGIKTAVKRLTEELGQAPEVIATGGRGRAAAFIRNEQAPPAPPTPKTFESHGLRFATPPGVFSSGELDPGSALLLEHLSDVDPAESIFDPGCGCGVLALTALARWPTARAVLADVDARAVTAAQANSAAAGMTDRARCLWWDARVDPPPMRGTCDLAVVNPPFHGGGTAVDLAPARAVFQAVGTVLRPGGRALIVANRTLPWERDLAAIGSVRMLRQTHDYKVMLLSKG